MVYCIQIYKIYKNSLFLCVYAGEKECRMRLDGYLHTKGYASSRAKAQAMLRDGVIYVNGVQIQKPAFAVDENDPPRIEIRGEVCPYVGRGGYKLAHALKVFSIDVRGFLCVDIGSSTGGFTDCLLQNGAKHVICVDAGHDQLAPSLREDVRTTVYEGFNAKSLDLHITGRAVELCVCDVSFISQTHLFEAVTRVLVPYDAQTGAGAFVSLIKPQFEVGRAGLSKNGIVKNEKVRFAAVERVLSEALTWNLYPMALTTSPIQGGDGNTEYLVHFVHDKEIASEVEARAHIMRMIDTLRT